MRPRNIKDQFHLCFQSFRATAILIPFLSFFFFFYISIKTEKFGLFFWREILKGLS
jgi:hypothetical protein